MFQLFLQTIVRIFWPKIQSYMIQRKNDRMGRITKDSQKLK